MPPKMVKIKPALTLVDICHVSCVPKPRKRRFLQRCEKLCEKNDATAQADSANWTKSYARKTSVFVCSLDGDEAAQTFLGFLEKLCEKNDATAQADSANWTKSYARKTSVFVCSLDGDEAAQTFLGFLEKLCEKTARRIYGLNEPHTNVRSNGQI
jgi:hypothetical protein